MKIHYSLPTNEAFFNRYATLIPTLSKLGFVAQLISALTEIGIIYSIILSRVADIAPEQANIIAMIGAIVGTAFLEIGLRKFTPYSVKAFLYKRFKGLDLAMSVFIISVCAGLFIASGVLSFKGSKDLVRVAAPLPELEKTDKIDKSYSEKEAALLSNFEKDKQTISETFNKRIEAEKARYNSLINVQLTKFNQYRSKEKRTGLNYQTRKESINRKIAVLKVDRAEKVATLETARANDLKELSKSRATNLQAVEKSHLSEKESIKSNNTANINKVENNVKRYGNGLAWFSLVCLSVFLFSVILEQIHKKGSGVEQTAHPNQYHFSQSILSELSVMINDKVNFLFRNQIQQWANTTPPPPVPLAPTHLYDLGSAKQPRLFFTIDESEKTEYSIKAQLPNIESKQIEIKNTSGNGTTQKEKPEQKQDLEKTLLEYLEAYLKLKECNLFTEAKGIELKAEQVIKSYLGNNATAQNIENLKTQIIGFLEGKNPNPFKHHHRQPIGFKPQKENIKETPIRKSLYENSTSSNQRLCAYCSNDYTYRHHKQKYCSDTCRIKAWEKRTGKDLKMKRKK